MSALDRARRLAAGLGLGLATLTAGCQGGQAPALAKLQPCQLADGPPDAYCGTLTVFEDRSARSGRTIDLKIVVAPALRRDARPDPLFIFEGGPGGGAATLAPSRVPLFHRFQTDRDIVLIDQRGTGASNPLDCTGDRPEVEDEDFRSLDDYPLDRYRRCLASLNADPRLYTTSIAMDDIDDVRAWLGYDQINLWGGSYGTRAALVYLKQHGDRVRSVILDGVAPPDMRLPLYVARDSQRALDRLFSDCANDAVCNAQFPGLAATVAGLWQQLESRPHITFVHPRTGKPADVDLSQRLVAGIVFQALYSPELTALLPRLLTDAAAGHYQGLLALAFTRTFQKGAMSDGMFLSVVCSEDVPRLADGDLAREAAGRLMGQTPMEAQIRPCAFWPRGTVPEDYYGPVTSATPVLIFSGENDPVTPPGWGQSVAEHLTRAKHIVVPGAGHITLTRGCVPELVATFLTTADPQAVDERCVATQKRPPFFASYTGPDTP